MTFVFNIQFGKKLFIKDKNIKDVSGWLSMCDRKANLNEVRINKNQSVPFSDMTLNQSIYYREKSKFK